MNILRFPKKIKINEKNLRVIMLRVADQSFYKYEEMHPNEMPAKNEREDYYRSVWNESGTGQAT